MQSLLHLPARRSLPRRWLLLLAPAALGLLALALAWRFTPLAEIASPEHVTALARRLAGHPWTAILLVLAYPLSTVIMFPRPLLTLFAVVAFGPYAGFGFAMLGISLSTLLTYSAGRALPARKVDRMMTDRLRRVREVLRSRALMGSIAVNIVPVAPFVAVGVAAGAMRVPLPHFLAGVLIGHLPGTLTTTIFGRELRRWLENSGAGFNPALLLGAVAFLVLMIVLVRRWFRRQEGWAEAAR